MLSIRVYAPAPYEYSSIDYGDASNIEISIGGYSCKPFTDWSSSEYSYDDVSAKYYIYELSGLKDGEKRKISFKIKGLMAATAETRP